MKKLLLLLTIFLVFSTPCFGAELLVKAVDAWGNDETRSRKGDIIVVRPDGWKWGREECPPRFVVVKLKGVDIKDVKHYEQPLMDKTNPEKPVMLKRRQYAIDALTVDTCSTELGGAKEISFATFNTKLTDKSK
jgi:hypothetical protein